MQAGLQLSPGIELLDVMVVLFGYSPVAVCCFSCGYANVPFRISDVYYASGVYIETHFACLHLAGEERIQVPSYLIVSRCLLSVVNAQVS